MEFLLITDWLGKCAYNMIQQEISNTNHVFVSKKCLLDESNRFLTIKDQITYDFIPFYSPI